LTAAPVSDLQGQGYAEQECLFETKVWALGWVLLWAVSEQEWKSEVTVVVQGWTFVAEVFVLELMFEMGVLVRE